MKHLLLFLLRWFPPHCGECGELLKYGFHGGELWVDACPCCIDDAMREGYENGRESAR